MFEKILISLLSDLVSWLYAKALFEQEIKKENQSIDKKKNKLKEVVNEMFDGQPVTKEQKEKFQKAVSDFIGTGNGVGL